MLQTKLVNAPLRGLIMGNAWIDPEIQYPAYLDFSYQEKLIAPGSADAMRAENVMRACNATLSTSGRGKVLVPECEGLLWAALPSPDACAAFRLPPYRSLSILPERINASTSTTSPSASPVAPNSRPT
jgi:hypothetical protein